MLRPVLHARKAALLKAGALAVLLTALSTPAAHAASDASDRRAGAFIRRAYHGDFRPPGGWYLPPLKTGSSRRPITPSERGRIQQSIGGHVDRFTALLWSAWWGR